MQHLINWNPLVRVTESLETTSDEVAAPGNKINTWQMDMLGDAPRLITDYLGISK